ncbi:MAG: glutamine amidotransferase, partial [Myxococcales bacterium]|nr:glutamine amidotransferase [Myxococcales bacterium]
MPGRRGGEVLIVRVGDASAAHGAEHGDYDGWVARGLAGGGPVTTRVVDPRGGGALPSPRDLAGVVVTGSSAMVTDRAEWSGRTAAFLREAVAADVPALGICYGHQLLADALGGEAGWNPRGREIGTVAITLTRAGEEDALLGVLAESGPVFSAQSTHRQVVLRLPEGAARLAENALDPNQAIRVGRRAWGVQFHPEFDAAYLRTLLHERRPAIEAEGLDADALLAGCHDTDTGP